MKKIFEQTGESAFLERFSIAFEFAEDQPIDGEQRPDFDAHEATPTRNSVGKRKILLLDKRLLFIEASLLPTTICACNHEGQKKNATRGS